MLHQACQCMCETPTKLAYSRHLQDILVNLKESFSDSFWNVGSWGSCLKSLWSLHKLRFPQHVTKHGKLQLHCHDPLTTTFESSECDLASAEWPATCCLSTLSGTVIAYTSSIPKSNYHNQTNQTWVPNVSCRKTSTGQLKTKQAETKERAAWALDSLESASLWFSWAGLCLWCWS